MRILLAEDEKALSSALAAILKHNNYSVDTVYDGQAVLEYLDSEIYDLLILDIMMPKKDGITVLKEFKNSEFEKEISNFANGVSRSIERLKRGI